MLTRLCTHTTHVLSRSTNYTSFTWIPIQSAVKPFRIQCSESLYWAQLSTSPVILPSSMFFAAFLGMVKFRGWFIVFQFCNLYINAGLAAKALISAGKFSEYLVSAIVKFILLFRYSVCLMTRRLLTFQSHHKVISSKRQRGRLASPWRRTAAFMADEVGRIIKS